LKAYITEGKRQTNQKLLRVRVDQGHEWNNHLWEDFCAEKSFIIEFTTAYAHEQNSAAERSMQTILDTAQTMLVESSLPTKYWPEAV